MGISYWLFWDTTHWIFFGQIWTQDSLRHLLWHLMTLILKYVNLWLFQGSLSILDKIGCLQKINFFSMKEQQHFDEAWGFRWAGPKALWWYHFWGSVTHLGGLVGIEKWRFWFLGGLSLHLNHLIQSRMEISYRLFGALPIGLLLSNLDSRQLLTSPRTLLGQFWHMSIFGYSRAVRVICQKKMPSENWFLFSMKEQQGFDEAWRVLGGQIPRLYGGTIFGGGATHLGHLVGHWTQKFHFFDTFAAD